MQIGNDEIKEIYVGSDQIKEVYFGSEKVWGEVESIQDGYWVHKDTGVKTYFDLEDSSIENGIMSSPSWAYDCSEVQIPSGVIGLGDNCFEGCYALTSINLPESVTSLGTGCFGSCSSLASITLPESLTSLGDYCFNWCDSFTSITLPEGITSLGEYCFSNCQHLTSITLPESLTSIGFGCFMTCTSLTSITLPENLTSIGTACFMECRSLTLATVLPAIPPSMGSGAFYDVHTSFNIKVRSPYVNDYKTATNWINYASIISGIQDGYWVHKDTGVKTYFWLDDPSITNGIMSQPSWGSDCSEVTIPVGVTSLSEGCFSWYESLTSINIPEGVVSLGDWCFTECTSLTSINIPESAISLGEGCFNGCSALTSITLPESLTSIGEICFMLCSSLTLATVLPSTPPSLGAAVFQGVHTSFNIKVRPPYVTAYKAATNWNQYSSKISAI